MTAIPSLSGHRAAAQRRAALDTLAIGLPLALVIAALGWRLSGTPGLLGAAPLALIALALMVAHRARLYDRRWLIGALDAHMTRFEDSSALLFRDPAELRGFASLQRARLEARIAEVEAIDLRPGWSNRRIASAWGIAVVLILAIVLWPAPGQSSGPGPSAGKASPPSGSPRVTGVRLRIIPPAYTGLPAREQTTLDARVAEGSRIEWTIDFAPDPSSAALVFPDGRPVPLVRDGTRWTGGQIVDRSLLYRVEADGLARQRLQRLDAIADAEPVVRIVDPKSQLVMVAPGQALWTPVFEASDDYGVIGTATLRIIVTKGEGENVTFEQRSIAVSGRGEPRLRQFSIPLDLGREGMVPGSDLIVQLIVSDNRGSGRQIVEGPSVILRWPVGLALADGLDGMAMSVMPAYFRSQRQIIIDAEALIAERRRVAPDRFVDRSNGLGNDQAQLRLRYGQFMGEEAEGGGSGGGGIALPTNDAPPARPVLPTSDAPAPPSPSASVDTEDHEGHTDNEGAPAFGSGVDTLNDFGHAHDSGEAATLFAPRTRSTLSLALDAMWSSERALRQGKPEDALPFANLALEYLKQAQQATRIFLARTGSNLPPVDFTRRLTGDRDDIIAQSFEPRVRTPSDAVAAETWRALQDSPGASRTTSLPLTALDRWVRENRTRLADPLGLAVAIDTVRNEPDCRDCRARLRALLWTALDRPPVAVRRRDAPGARGQRYLDALQ